MAKSLVIVESPAKAKTINKFLGSGYVVKHTGGHIIDLPTGEFGIDIENDFKPQYEVIKGKNKIVKELKKAAKEVDTVFLATDPDREGEAIAWHVATRVIDKNQKSFRVLINQITKDAVIKAVQNKGELDLKKVYAQQARRVLDRLVGYKVSPILWKTMYSGLSAGRVQSVALRLIVERDGKIAEFVPDEYWNIRMLLTTKLDEEFEAKLLKKDGKTLKIKTAKESQKIVEDLSSLPVRVKGISTKKSIRNPAPPFITSSLQQEAARRLGFTVSRTMGIAQSLYEGVDLEDGTTGLITYMRTDSTRIAPEAIDEVRAFIGQKWGKDNIPSKPNFYRTKKSAQDAHEAVRPASISRSPGTVKAFLKPDQMKLYSLIWNRFVASQMKPAVYTVFTIDITAGHYELRSDAKHLDYEGFLMVYTDQRQDDEEESIVSILPKCTAGDELNLKEIIPSQHFTIPPARFTEASLVKELEELGVGRPSTYAQIINTILTREYVQREKGKLISTDLGKSVNKILVQSFPDLFSVNFTANMELELDKIESGEYEWYNVVNDFYIPFSKSLEKVNSQRKELKESLIEQTDEICEKCGKPMIIRWGRRGKFMACSGFPACKNTRPVEGRETETTDEVCEKCGSMMEIKTGRYGRFLACSGYPKCKNIKPLSLGVKCPVEGCDGEILEKKSKKGKLFYGCNRYPGCTFVSWNKPVAVTCPECKCPALIESKDGELYSCFRCGSKFDSKTLGK